MNELLEELKKVKNPIREAIARQAIPQIKQLVELGLGYLNLSRKMDTLSGGEGQRVKIARHLGSSLNNLTYIFDEPSAGLHPEEVDLLIQMLKNIKAHHNTVLVIEHDLSIIKIADEIIEMGPGAGANGGEIVYQGKLAGLKKSQAVTTLDHQLKVNKNPRNKEDYCTIKEAYNHNLKQINVNIPKNVFVSVCGVSGRSEEHTSELQSRGHLVCRLL